MRFGDLIPVLAVGGWVVMVLYRMHLAGQAKERHHRERMAMIERGLVPPPDSDLEQFDRMMDWRTSGGSGRDRGAQSRRTGVTLIGVGLGLTLMLYLVDAGRASGAGALLVVMGIAFLVNAMFEARPPRDQQPRTPTDAPND